MTTPAPGSPQHTVRNAIVGGLATVIVATISGYSAVRVAHINAQTEFKKSSLGYTAIADRMNKLEEHVSALEKAQAQQVGTIKEMNQLLQGVLEAQSGLTHKDYPPPDVKTYEGLEGPDRPYRRFPIGRRVPVPTPKVAAAQALHGLRKLEQKPIVVPKPLPNLEPLPAKLENVTK